MIFNAGCEAAVDGETFTIWEHIICMIRGVLGNGLFR